MYSVFLSELAQDQGPEPIGGNGDADSKLSGFLYGRLYEGRVVIPIIYLAVF